MKPTISLSLALLAAAFILSTTTATFVNPSCALADDKVLCSQLAQGGKTWSKSMTNMLKAVLVKTNAAKPIVSSIGSKLPHGLKPVTKDSIDSTCHEMFQTIIDNLKQCIGFVKEDYDSLKVYLSAVSFSECTDGLEEFGVHLPEATQFNDEVQKLVGALLAVADKKPGHA